jgi:hypothetical protein
MEPNANLLSNAFNQSGARGNAAFQQAAAQFHPMSPAALSGES